MSHAGRTDSPPGGDASMLDAPRVERGSIAARAGVVGLGTLFSRVLGLGRDLVLAALFPRAVTDLFFVAFTIPNALRQLLAEGALASAFVPVLAAVETQSGPRAAEKFYAKLRGTLWVVLVTTCALGVVAAGPLCELFAAGFHARPGAFARTVGLTRVLFPYLLFMGLAALGAGALQTRRRFAVAAFAPALLNVAMIACAVALRGIFAAHGIDPIYTLAVGALLGGALQVTAQRGELKRAGFGGPLRIDLGDPAVRDVVRRIGPMALGLMIYEVDLVLSRRFLSECPEGANSFFYYAQRLCDFPQGIFSLALATATLPSLSALAAKNDRVELARTATHALRLALFVAIPASALLIGLARPLVMAIFARGAFDATSVQGTRDALVIQGMGVFVVAIVRQLVPLFYAMGNTRTPVVVSGLDLLAFILIAVTLRPHLGHVAISMAVTGSSLVQMLLLAFATRDQLPELKWSSLFPSTLRTTLASLVAAGLAWACALAVAGIVAPHRAWNGLAQALAGAAIFAVAFGLVGALTRSPEQAALLAGLRRRFARGASGAHTAA